MISIKGLIFFCGLLAVISFINAQAPDTLWTRTYGGINTEQIFEIHRASDSGYVLVGVTDSYGAGGIDAYLLKIDAEGDSLWTKTYGGSSTDAAHCMCVSSDNGFVLAGSQETGDHDIYVFKTDSLGNIVWTRTYGGMMNDWADGVCVAEDGGYVVTGSANVNNYLTSGSVVLMKLDENGDTAWTKIYGGSAYNFGSTICPTADSGFIVCGFTNSFGAGGLDVWLLKTDADGDTLWTKTFGGTGNDEAQSVQQTMDGGYILTGYTGSYGAGGWDVYVIKTDSEGDCIWTRTYGGSEYDIGLSVIQTVDHEYIITGSINGSSEWERGDLWLLKLDENGDSLWTTSIGGNGDDWGCSVLEIADDEYIVGGGTSSFGAGNVDVYIVRFGSGPGFEESQEIRSPDKRSYTTFIQGPLTMFVGKKFKVFDITGCEITTKDPAPGIYFIESDGSMIQKVIKIK